MLQNITKSKKHIRLRSLNSPRHFLQLMMSRMYFILKLRGSQQSSYGIYHAQTNIQTNYNYLLCLACLAPSASMFAQSSLPDHAQDKSNNISVRSKLLQNQSVTVSQKPECFNFNLFLTKLETYIGSLLPLSDKICRDFLFSISTLHLI